MGFTGVIVSDAECGFELNHFHVPLVSGKDVAPADILPSIGSIAMYGPLITAPVPAIPPLEGLGTTAEVRASAEHPNALRIPAAAPADAPTMAAKVETPASSGPTTSAVPNPQAGPLSVAPISPVAGQGFVPNTSAFLISARATPTTPIVVPFTIAAHSASGTQSFNGSVTLDGARPQAAVSPRPVSGASPEVLTVVVHPPGGEAASVRGATVFVLPTQQIRDTVLVEAHREGRSAEAFGVLTQRHMPAVNRTCLRIVGNPTDAQDVSQSVFMELAKTRVRFPGSLTGWLRVVSRNAALAFLRAKRRRQRHEQRAARSEQFEAPSVVFDESLTVALRQLPPDLSQAVRLRYLDGYSQQEAAEIVGVPRGTLSRRAAEGVQILRSLLEWEPEYCEQPYVG